ncbi:MAG: SusD/RagB family nutrient-binding outer membrane lipoprotein, partial [Bacteroidota bacterium]
MKKIVILLLALLMFSACKKLGDLNENTKDPTNVTGESLFTGAQKNLFDQMVSTNVNENVYRLFVQYW